jgi:hypothetical protein
VVFHLGAEALIFEEPPETLLSNANCLHSQFHCCQMLKVSFTMPLLSNAKSLHSQFHCCQTLKVSLTMPLLSNAKCFHSQFHCCFFAAARNTAQQSMGGKIQTQSDIGCL